MKSLVCLPVFFCLASSLSAQPANCSFKQPAFTIHFGAANVRDANNGPLAHYERTSNSCPTDGHYAFVSSTANCFHDDWHTLAHDHTGNANGNMMLVNGAYSPGVVLRTTVTGLKGGMDYQFGVWLMNLCKPSDKCPFPLLPNLTIRLETTDGTIVAQSGIGELPRVATPRWDQHLAYFTTPPSVNSLTLTIVNSAPGGCGNDFAMDDITFSECVKTPLPLAKASRPATSVTTPAKPVTTTASSAKAPKSGSGTPHTIATRSGTRPPTPKTPSAPTGRRAIKRQLATITRTPAKAGNDTAKTHADPGPSLRPFAGSPMQPAATSMPKRSFIPPPPLELTSRENPLVKRIEVEAAEIRIDVYDNGEIDGDTVTIYHNNTLVKAHAGLSDKPITFTLKIDDANPHHELVMVADNLGSIPPNTSVMVVTTPTNRYEVFISSTRQKNAKVVFDLKH